MTTYTAGKLLSSPGNQILVKLLYGSLALARDNVKASATSNHTH